MSDAAEAAPPLVDVSAGALLRRAREASGLHVAALAVSLKVPVRKLEALEDDRYEDLGDAVFIRGLASSVCRTLKVDPQPVLERLPRSAAPRLVKVHEGLNAPFRAPSDNAPPGWRDALRQPVPLTVLALLVGAVVIYLLPNLQRVEELPVAGPSTPAPSVLAAAQPAAPPASEPAAAPVAIAAVAPAAMASSPAAGEAKPEAVAAAPVPADGIVVIRTKGDSWIEVVDAKGVAAVRKLMTPGETAGASGVLPLTVTIGRVDMTEVEVRGRKFDLRPVSKDNVARFEVK